MPATTALDLITDTFNTLGVLAPGQPVSPDDSSMALRMLNIMTSGWAIQPGSIPCVGRDVYDMTANKGGPSNPYTIGPTGDWVATVPNDIEGAAVMLTQATPNFVEVPLALLTDDAWQAIQIKDLSNQQPTCLYYNKAAPATSTTGTINLWPVPSVAYNKIVLYRLQQLGQFANLSTSYNLPDGWAYAIIPNLAKRIAPTFGRQVTPDIQEWALTSLQILKRSNNKLADLPQDIFTGNRIYGYNINTGNM